MKIDGNIFIDIGGKKHEAKGAIECFKDLSLESHEGFSIKFIGKSIEKPIYPRNEKNAN